MTGALDQAERIARIRLARSENVGPILFRTLVERFGAAATALDALPELSRRGGRRRPIRVCPQDAAEDELEMLTTIGADILVLGDPDYPRPLAAIDDPPPVIALLGDKGWLRPRAAAIVGSRNASANGRRFAGRLAADLGAADFVVVSGMARGIDAAAHEGALPTGTVAVVAGGIDVVYPKQNEALYREIAERGLVVAENPPGAIPQARNFPRRNRIISGLALGTVVVEAAQRSGSLITARLAAEQGREVFAVPGSPLDPRCRGTNDLLRQGATLVEEAGDVIDALVPMDRHIPAIPTSPAEIAAPAADPPQPAISSDARDQVVEALSPTPIAIDDLIRTCGLAPAIVQSVLLELELAGRVERQPGGRFALSE